MFFILPIGVDYNARRYPVVTFTLMGICTVVHLIAMAISFNNDALYEWWEQTFWLVPEKSLWFSYLTAMFVHGDIFHLLGNMAYLFLFGSCVEDTIGRGRFLAFYLISGLVSSFAYIAFSPQHFDSAIPMGGASGAISACMGAFVMLLHKAKIEFKWMFILFFRFFAGEFHLPAWLVLSFWFLEDVAGMLLDLNFGDGASGGTAFGAHVGGFVMGMVVMVCLKPMLKREAAAEEEQEAFAEAAEAAAAASAPPEDIFAKPSAPKRVLRVGQPAEDPLLLLFDRGSQFGPYPLTQVCQMVREGTVTREALYWQEGMTEWKGIGDLA